MKIIKAKKSLLSSFLLHISLGGTETNLTDE